MKVNGKFILLQNKIYLCDFLKSNGYNINKIAIEINKQIINPKNYKDILLNNDDKIEIVNFVGGG